ncbi:hypothetical protein ACLGI4_11415 [Streptomyces sp. HMX112]|uniref:hypothetical protein n=1 Tax=Streptomyces sp. HMX112 TaxID=3390850 RepID=UPI003A80F321
MALDPSFFTSSIAEEIRAQGRAQGRAEGRAEGRAQAVLIMLEQRGVEVSPGARDRITTGCQDRETAYRWLTRAVTALSVEDVFEGD